MIGLFSDTVTGMSYVKSLHERTITLKAHSALSLRHHLNRFDFYLFIIFHTEGGTKAETRKSILFLLSVYSTRPLFRQSLLKLDSICVVLQKYTTT